MIVFLSDWDRYPAAIVDIKTKNKSFYRQAIKYKIMNIKVLGTGCAGCKALYATVEQVVKELALEAVVTKEEDLMKIMEYNVMTLPALVVDGKVVAKGKLSAKEVKDVLTK